MPQRYEAIRDSIYQQNVKKGMKPAAALAAAKSVAAATFNKTRAKGEAPVTGPAKGEKPATVKDVQASVRGKSGKKVARKGGGTLRDASEFL